VHHPGALTDCCWSRLPLLPCRRPGAAEGSLKASPLGGAAGPLAAAAPVRERCDRGGSARGRLEVRIIEARNLTFGSGVFQTFHTLVRRLSAHLFIRLNVSLVGSCAAGGYVSTPHR